ncbi:MAG TPA: class I SAM-dependent methyltransferase [Streptosporangiaceae bacterium]|nr:class I SAM-dependent methyltransferase [Streptosporangiaceae bacterium]
MRSAAGNRAAKDRTDGHAGGTVVRMGEGAAGAGGTAAGSGPGAAGTAPACGDGAAQRAVRRARQAASRARQAAASEAERAGRVREMFARPVHDYMYKALGRPVAVLRAGGTAPLEELGLDELRAGGFEITVTTVDQDHPATRAALAAGGTGTEGTGTWPSGRTGQEPRAPAGSGAALPEGGTGRSGQHDPGGLRGQHDPGSLPGQHGSRGQAGPPGTGTPVPGDTPILGDLRSIPLPPRSFDILYCALLLERIPHATLVLDRFLAALRPGGLILLRARDRDCAAAALDRLLPEVARRVIWARLHPGEPGPFPAVYDPLASERGIRAYAARRDLVIIRRETARTPPGAPSRLADAVSAARTFIAWLSRGRLTDAHDELLYVIRRPEDRFARLV